MMDNKIFPPLNSDFKGAYAVIYMNFCLKKANKFIKYMTK